MSFKPISIIRDALGMGGTPAADGSAAAPDAITPPVFDPPGASDWRPDPAARVRAPSRTVFARRAARLRQLADGHALADFLLFCAALCDEQQRLLDSDDGHCALGGLRVNLDAIVAGLRPRFTPGIAAAVADLQARDDTSLGLLGVNLAGGRLPEAGAAFAALPVLGAALQVGAVRSALVNAATAELPDHEVLACPVCGGAPVASVLRRGESGQAERHAVCGVCASEWHVSRIRCLACGGHEGISYQALVADGDASVADATAASVAGAVATPAGADEASGAPKHRRPAVELECCDNCHAATKIVSLERDPAVDPVADDLATLPLDWLAAEEGWLRYGFNLFFLAPEEEVIEGDDDFAEEDGRA
ncbi:formate dehydrogenase accessory protein FdhE [Derxia gummosa]|uniref:Formate dehydrogenase accessory protein FdhE n=1 Tax=Derxia gummosa DSM 723 TaxID=1121388 RepID=A0A8B6X723_9BURK|nr:formate dehydrogenase accessory protein FdhE [Derxia gummosa]